VELDTNAWCFIHLVGASGIGILPMRHGLEAHATFSSWPQNDKGTRAMTTDGQNLRLIWIKRSADFLVVSYGSDRLLIDFFNDIAFLQFGHATIGIDIRDDDTANAVRKIELAGQIRSQIGHVN
jgi:hypothetical protein